MKKLITNTVFALIGLVMFAFTAQAQTPPANTPCITMTVTKDSTVRINMMAAETNTLVWIETTAGDYTQVMVGTNWVGFTYHIATGTTIKVHGNLKGFNCSYNFTKITGLTFSSGLTNLLFLLCSENSISALDVSKLTNLITLSCYENSISALDVSRLKNLTQLYCYKNSISALDVSGLKKLESLYCYSNSLKTLKVSGLTNLESLYCHNNSLTTLDVSGLTNLTKLYCSGNSLKTLNASGLTNLIELDCSRNSLTSLDVSGQTNLTKLSCFNNFLTSLDVSGLTSLKILYCSNNNNFSPQAIDDIYCALPQRLSTDNAKIYPVYNSSSTNLTTVMKTNKQNAIDKNWRVIYQEDNKDIPPTTGNYACGTPYAGAPYITLTVTSGTTVQIAMQAAAAGTPVWIETEADSYMPVTVDTNWTSYGSYTATDTIIKVHGNLQGFDCRGNTTKLTGLTFSSGLTNLTALDCDNNSLTALDVSELTNLTTLSCSNNFLTTLDVSGLTNLRELYCDYNSLTVLDVSGLTNLKSLYCCNNNFSTQAIDDIYCGLPQRKISDNARIYPVYDGSSANHATVLATNKQNAINKKWEVLYYSNDAEIPVTMGTYTCGSTPPIGTPYITMTVTKDSTVQIKMKAAVAGTPVWVEAATGTYTPVTVGIKWTNFVDYIATGTTIKVYGNLKGFDCSENTTKLTNLTFSNELTNLEELNCSYNALTTLDVSELTNLTRLSCFNNSLTTLDVSWLTNLKRLDCYNNNFSTPAIDDIYCGLPRRQISDNAIIYPIYNSTSADTAVVFATNKQNATDKNWKVQYASDNTDISTTGMYECGSTPPSGTPYITMIVTKDSAVQIDMKAAADNTLVWVETKAGSYTQVIVGTSGTGYNNYTALDTIIKVHGNLNEFGCSGNTTKLTGLTFSSESTNLIRLSCFNNSLTTLDVSGLTNLTSLYCYNNTLGTLDVSGLTNLTTLSCSNNSLDTLDVSGLTNLRYLSCYNSSLSALNVNGLTNLEKLYCYSNSLTTLDVSGLTNLEKLYCYSNSLTTLDVSGLTNLKKLYCYSNNFSTQAIDDIYCSLPKRDTVDNAIISPIYKNTSADTTVVFATNKQNATDKNWKVQYYSNSSDIPETTGSYVCGTGIADVVAAGQMSIYPNPAKEMVTIELSQSYTGMLQITDISGKTLISHKINGTHVSVDISALSKGIYFVKVGSQINKLIVK